jgi:hypothetical protein
LFIALFDIWEFISMVIKVLYVSIGGNIEIVVFDLMIGNY